MWFKVFGLSQKKAEKWFLDSQRLSEEPPGFPDIYSDLSGLGWSRVEADIGAGEQELGKGMKVSN